MVAITRKAKEFLHLEDGPAAVEYALLLALVLGGAIATMATFGDNVNALYETVATTVGLG